MSEFKQTSQFDEAVSSIMGIVDNYLAFKMKYAVNVAVQIQSNKLIEEAQAENQEFLNQIDSNIKSIIKEQTPYAVATSLSESKLKKILIDKMETNKSMNRADIQKDLYIALVESYNTDKVIMDSYGDVVTLKRGRDDQDKDEDPYAGSNRGSQPKSSGKSAHAEEHGQKVNDLEDQLHQEFNTGNDDVALTVDSRPPQPWITQMAQAVDTQSSFNEFLATPIDFSAFIYHLEEVFKATNDRLDWHNPEGKPYPHDLSKPIPLIQNEQGRQVIPFDHFINNDLEYLKGGSSSHRYTTSITKTKAANYGQVKWIEEKKFYGYASNMETSKDVYSRHKIIVVTSLKIMECFGYSHLEEIVVRRRDDQLYKFRECDFKRLRRQDIENMSLLLVQDKLNNLNLEERYALNVALRMFTRRIVIQECMEDLQLGVESYQKKINLKRPDTYHSDLRSMTTYTTYPDIQGIIYEDKMNTKRLMHTDEFHRFSDGTLNHVRTALNDIALGIEMDYLPKIKWSKQDKQRARVMINAIDKKLRDRRLMRNLEKFIGGRPYGGDLRLLERTI
ncbi:hypothetical protein Tco_0661287 [Tanacetum coccineum]